ncbi:single-stranded DNA-binding protein [Candidatus Peregrinibacteria bacterium]|nr:MAG: single-stranded DNA-binding protein [Candidatus Peregrinibacteria bacterium]
MRNINKVILIGNVARAPDIRTTAGGQKMATFVLATNRTWYDPQGHKQSQAEFHNMLSWGKISEICERFLQKSTLIYIEGYLKTRSWEGENGVRLYRTEIVVQDILVLDRGIRHDANNEQEAADYDSYEDMAEFGDGERSPLHIEEGIRKHLEKGSTSRADVTFSGGDSSLHNASPSYSLEEPLFEEESR